MKHLKVLYLLLIPGLTQAGTIVESVSANGQTMTMYIEGQMARHDIGTSQSMLFDFKNQRYLMMQHGQKQVLDVSPSSLPKQQAPQTSAVKTEIKQVGKGPEIVGYATMHQKMFADGQLCSEQFTSEKAAENKDVQQMKRGMYQYAESMRAIMPSAVMAFMTDPCAKAGMQMDLDAMGKGIPLKSVDRNGRVMHEIKSIKGGQKIDPEKFKVPSGYQTVKPMEQMQQMQQNMPKMSPEQMKQMQEMMQKMQQRQQ